jgi:hypothetical protein
MSSKKIESILSLIEIAETNLKNAKAIAQQLIGDKTNKSGYQQASTPLSINKSSDEDRALEVVEGYFNGESMIGDNGQNYIVPPNYASKTQLVVGDRMKWILTPEREVFKLIQPAPRERVTGTFGIEGDNYVVLVNQYPNPIKILKASATFAIKNLGLQIGDEVAVFIAKESTPTWGAFSSVVKNSDENKPREYSQGEAATDELDLSKEFGIQDFNLDSNNDYF